jgi:hypothetical protein
LFQPLDAVLQKFRPKRFRQPGPSLTPRGRGRGPFESIIDDSQVHQDRTNGLVGIQDAMDHRPDRHRRREDSIPPCVAQVVADELDLLIAQEILKGSNLDAS